MVTPELIQENYQTLMKSYVKAKPLLNDVYKRNGGELPEAILNEIRAINDHVARFFDNERTDKQKLDEIARADGHLKRMIYDVYKQLNIFFFDYMTEFEDNHFGAHWLRIDKGKFWLSYVEKRDFITEYVRQAKVNESISTEAAMEWYQKAYTEQRYVYQQIQERQNLLVLSEWKKKLVMLNSQRGWLLSTICLAVIPALLWEFFANFSRIATFVSTHLSALFRAFCEWGLSI